MCPQFLITLLRLGVQGKGQVSYQRKSKGEESFPSGPKPKLPKLIYSLFPRFPDLVSLACPHSLTVLPFWGCRHPRPSLQSPRDNADATCKTESRDWASHSTGP